MPSTRKSRNVNKKYSKVNEESPDKDGGSGKKNKQRKRKLSDMVGPQWSKEELECFYEAYRKYKKDWKKVSSVIRNRSAEMVEALYNINRAYLSLQEREVSAAGLIAMMTDHYNMLEGSDSDRESNDGSGLQRKPQKRARAKFKVNNSKGSEEPVPDLLQNFSSSYGCLPLLKKKRCGGTRPRAVGKRTPRFPVSFPFDKGGRARFISPSKRDLDSEVDPDDDDVAHVVARALAEASQRGGSPQVSRTPSRGTEHVRQSPVHNGEKKNPEAGMDGSKLVDAVSEDCLEGSLESREAETGDTSRTTSHRGLLDTEGAFSAQIQRKAKKFQGKNQKNHGIENNQFDDVREACSGTEEGLSLSPVKDKSESEVAGGRNMKSTPESTKKRGRQLFFGDESSALDALQTLADLSLNILFPSSTVESESSIQVKAEKRGTNVVHKPSAPESISANLQIDKSRISKDKEKGHSSVHGTDTVAIDNARSGKDLSLDAGSVSEIKHRLNPSANTLRKGKRKSSNGKIPQIELHNDSHPCDSQKTEVLAGEGKRSTSKSKQVSQTVVQPKHGKSVKPERSSSTDLGRNGTDLTESVVQVPTLNQGSLPIRRGSRRKMELQKSLVRKELKTVENVANDRSTVNSRTPKYLHSVHERVVSLKDKLSHCLSSQMLRRWCTFEWFYSAIDYPWFARSEFVEYLNHVGLGHVPRLTRVEWGVIRSSLGKPRRLSEQFLREEREKLEQYRESVRTHYTELRTGIRDGLATDLARPLSVGQRVIACHPKTREIHDGSILTVDRNRCRVQFDRPELGVEFVMDIDCMPLNPLENLPEVLRRQNIGAENFREDSNEAKLDVKPKDWKAGVYTKFTSGENSGIVMDGPFHVAPSNYPMSTLFKQAKGDTLDAIMQAKAAVNQVAVAAQQAMYTQPCTFAQIQAREDDIKALAGLTRALDKKEALLMELRHMNEEVSSNQKDGESVRDSENFKKQYAMVLVQLKDANDQVASALFYLRQRNTYQDNSPPWPKSSVNGGLTGTFDNTFPLVQDSGCNVMEVVENSRKKARTMVDAAVQAMSSLKEGENPFERVGKATDLANNRHSGTDAVILAGRSCPLSDPGHGTSSSHQDQATSCTSEPTAAAYASSPKQNNSSDRNEVQLPSELISSCVATLLMIQTCTERQYPPAEMAQILDTAVTNLQPCCPQNIAIYAEIQQLMGIVKNQILALLPTQHIVLPPELPAG